MTKAQRIAGEIGKMLAIDGFGNELYIMCRVEGELVDIKKAIAAKLEAEYGPVEEAAIERPKIICLCGSSRFIDYMAILAWEFEKVGAITLSLHLLPMNYAQCEDHLAEKQGVAEQMDALHLKKIDMADEVFIVNKDGYIGDSTKREIKYALEHHKPIKWIEPEHAEQNLASALTGTIKERT